MPKRKKSKSNGDWDRVPINEEFLGDKEFENLLSLEVLTDYELIKNDGICEVVEKGIKRKAEETDEINFDDENNSINLEDDETETQAITKETKKPKKTDKQKEKPSKKEHQTNVISTTNWTVVVEEKHDDEKVVKSKKPKLQKNENKRQKLDSEMKEKIKGQSNEVDQDQDVSVTEASKIQLHEWVKLGVPDVVLKALEEKGFEKPTSIQLLTLPAAILGKKDIVGAAETGSGKTLAFAIPIISGILKNITNIPSDSLQALILTPTRELTVQIKNHIDAVAKFTNIKSIVIVGGLASQKQERLLKTNPEIIIATPGRLWELAQSGNEYLSHFSQIKYLVVDETDRMVEKGHFQELKGILEVVNKEEEYKVLRQNFVFSATLSFTHEPPKRFKIMSGSKGKKIQKPQAKKIDPREKLREIMEMIGVRTNAKIVDITSSKGTCETLTEMQISCDKNQKDYYMYYFFIQHPGRTIVFCNSINCVRRLVNLFFFLKCGAMPLHSEMHQKQRLKNLEKFTTEAQSVLIATDVAARGLDIKDVQHVIHYQVPKTAESYIHRSGRTARAFKGGLALLLMDPSENGSFWNICRSLGRDQMLPTFQIDNKVFKEIKYRVDLAVKVEQFEHTVRKKLSDINWFEKARKEMDLASSSEDEDSDSNLSKGSNKKVSKKDMQKAKKELEKCKLELNRLLGNNALLLKNNSNLQSTLKQLL